MSDARETPDGAGTGGQEDDGLDAWLAANFPPKAPDALPPAEEPPAVPPVAEEPPAVPPVAEELAGLPPEPDVPADPTVAFGAFGADSALDTLFGESKFRDYLAEPGPSENPFATRTIVVDTSGGDAVPPATGIPRSQKVLMWIAGSLVAVLALVALFLLGTKLADLLGPAPAVVSSPTNTPTPTATALPLGPVEPGVYRWDELIGGECHDPYNGPWEQEFTVVDCAGPHPAQLATRGTFGPDDGLLTPYPGMPALQSQLNLLCTASTVIDYAAANAYTDIQFEGSFAVTSDDWVAGDRDYYCFLSRTSGGPIEGSIAMPQVAPTPSPSPTP